MAVLDQIKKTFRISHEKQWYETYWTFDIHGTILKPTYDLKKKSIIRMPKKPYAFYLTDQML